MRRALYLLVFLLQTHNHMLSGEEHQAIPPKDIVEVPGQSSLQIGKVIKNRKSENVSQPRGAQEAMTD